MTEKREDPYRIETKEYHTHKVDTRTFNSIEDLIKWWVLIIKDRSIDRRLRDGVISEEEYENDYMDLRVQLRELVSHALRTNAASEV